MKKQNLRSLMGLGCFGWMSAACIQAEPVVALTEPVGYMNGTVVDEKNPNIVLSTPVGTDVEPLGFGLNLYGIRLHHGILAAGKLGEFGEKDVRIVLEDASVQELPLVKGATYILEITSGGKNGVIQEITKWQGLRLKLPDAIQDAGVKTGDAFTLRRAPTLNEIFDPRTTPLQGAKDSLAADKVMIPRGISIGDFQACYLLDAPEIGRRVWLDMETGTPVGDTPLVYADGLIIQRVSPQPVTLPSHGAVKTGPTRHVVSTGLNLVATPYPASSSLQQLGLQHQLQKNADPAKADKVWLPVRGGGGMMNQYFIDESGAWVDFGTFETVTNPVPVGSAILIERIGAPALLILGNQDKK